MAVDAEILKPIFGFFLAILIIFISLWIWKLAYSAWKGWKAWIVRTWGEKPK
jgi:hypothetical protein